jgi:WD40 repeat protein
MNNIIDERYTEIATLRGHTYGVNCLTLHENKLYSGSDDKTIRIWKVGDLEKRKRRTTNFCIKMSEDSGAKQNSVVKSSAGGATGLASAPATGAAKPFGGAPVTGFGGGVFTKTNCILGVMIILFAFGTQKLTKI